jgi:hypothetical protein
MIFFKKRPFRGAPGNAAVVKHLRTEYGEEIFFARKENVRPAGAGEPEIRAELTELTELTVKKYIPCSEQVQ